jgi:hypothetical protein
MLALVLLPWVSVVAAQSNSPNYAFLLASGFLCDSGDTSTCPAVAKSQQGDSYELSGAGTFEAQNKSVKAAGTFTHKAPNGNVLDSGVWIASELMGFVSYGIAPGALRQQGIAIGPQQFGPKRLPMLPGPMPTGGLAIFRVVLIPVSGARKTAVLQVNCALGDVPPDRSAEGIRIRLETNDFQYSEEVSGRVMFLALRPEASTPAKMPEQEARPAASQQPQK